ncbi:MAG TPA: bifunctional DNA-formamidopyrimidine glycosylase/DNA-(apurinic or apyrimidinic site) lyase [Pyrinomonadaceae bacterium]|nr:bifunctional DNA-formamidopyrimidine glycosylase/DNA-(apurinic or apyrimidinic site) lyase [Pyrinomonadaceae bacterium]
MPELPEVEHVVRALRRSVNGSRIVASEVTLPKLISPLSTAVFNRKLKNARITAVNRRGKYILIELDNRLTLAVHLRMTGQFLVLKPDDELPRHAHAVFYLEDERRLVFRDQRQFGVMKLLASSRINTLKGISELAPEPFSDEFSLAYLKETLAKSRRTLKTLLLDQTRVLGLGNIYAAEALFRARINPFKIASELSTKRVTRLHQAIRDVLRAAVSGNSSSRISLENAEGFSYGEAFGRIWQVYEREGEPCFKCGARIRRLTHGGRSTYWCPTCQRR